ncbi:hypothetical protein NBRC116595_10880 [Aliiglaciecola sp. NS0011-25]
MTAKTCNQSKNNVFYVFIFNLMQSFYPSKIELNSTNLKKIQYICTNKCHVVDFLTGFA